MHKNHQKADKHFRSLQRGDEQCFIIMHSRDSISVHFPCKRDILMYFVAQSANDVLHVRFWLLFGEINVKNVFNHCLLSVVAAIVTACDGRTMSRHTHTRTRTDILFLSGCPEIGCFCVYHACFVSFVHRIVSAVLDQFDLNVPSIFRDIVLARKCD